MPTWMTANIGKVVCWKFVRHDLSEIKTYPKLDEELNPEDKFIIGTGSGLGLSIVKEIIVRRNGSIDFKQPTKEWKTDLEIIVS